MKNKATNFINEQARKHSKTIDKVITARITTAVYETLKANDVDMSKTIRTHLTKIAFGFKGTK